MSNLTWDLVTVHRVRDWRFLWLRHRTYSTHRVLTPEEVTQLTFTDNYYDWIKES